ncbi:MAG: hypothetical protein GF387_01355 [Candidatus Portnoybacteria bacterium]|nr:hypothetical protein [Candidatus Portnoybacteria bacterium]
MPEVNLVPEGYKKKKGGFLGIFSKIGGMVLILFILSLLVYGGLLFYEKSLSDKLDKIEEDIKLVKSKRSPEKEEEIINLDKKLEIVENIFKDHLYWSEMVGKLESLIVPEVYFFDSEMTFNLNKMNLFFTANAANYTSLARQMVSFQEEEIVEKVDVSGIQLSSEGGIDFNLSVVFSNKSLDKEND